MGPAGPAVGGAREGAAGADQGGAQRGKGEPEGEGGPQVRSMCRRPRSTGRSAATPTTIRQPQPAARLRDTDDDRVRARYGRETGESESSRESLESVACFSLREPRKFALCVWPPAHLRRRTHTRRRSIERETLHTARFSPRRERGRTSRRSRACHFARGVLTCRLRTFHSLQYYCSAAC